MLLLVLFHQNWKNRIVFEVLPTYITCFTVTNIRFPGPTIRQHLTSICDSKTDDLRWPHLKYITVIP